MKRFEFVKPETVSEATPLLREGGAVALAGGTDLLGVLGERLLPTYPEKVVSLQALPNMAYIKEEQGQFKIGAMTTLADIAASDAIKQKLSALAEAANSVATPILRNRATIGGNLCQDVRCWYYRSPHHIGGRLDCARKEGELCYAMMGENRYHSIFGAVRVNQPPCTSKCPAGTDIPSYTEKLRAGDVDGAAEIILQVNPMPAITSRVCAHFCQEKCNRNNYDENVNIESLERYVGDHILETPGKFMKAPAKENGKTASIIGAGPAGLAAAYYLRREGYTVVMYERMKEAGGALMYAIPAFRLPKDIVRKFTKALEDMGVVINTNTMIGPDGVSLEDIVKKSDSVMLDTGTWKRPLIGISGEELTRFGLDFLVDVNNYIHERPGSDVVVVGGGNVAVDVAITAKRLGAPKVSMVCLEQRDEMPAGLEEIERVIEEGVELINGWGPKSILKEDSGVQGVEFKRCTKVFDDTGRFSPEYDDEDTMAVAGDVALMAIGQQADLTFLEGAYSVETERGRIKAAEGNATSVEGIFAGGDVTTGPATVIEAITAGRRTAISMADYMGEAIQPGSDSHAQQGQCGECLHRFDPVSRQKDNAVKLKVLSPGERSIEKEDAYAGISKKEMSQEAARCFNCGCLAVNPSDISNLLIAADATILTTERAMSAEEFFTANSDAKDTLNPGELIREIQIPIPDEDTVLKYDKFRIRESIDFAIVALATWYKLDGDSIADARVVMGAVAPIPMRMRKVEEFLKGKRVDDDVRYDAADIALEDELPLQNNAFKIDIAKAMVRRSLNFV